MPGLASFSMVKNAARQIAGNLSVSGLNQWFTATN
jgi:hypothetical protein